MVVFSKSSTDFITVCADGGIDMIRAAVENAEGCGVFVVTALTSLSEEQCEHIYYDKSLGVVYRFALDAVRAGAEGIICSPKELEVLKMWATGEYRISQCLTVITPGIRPKWYCKDDDQKRVTTPYDAITNGSDYLVIGRPITQAEDIKTAAELTYKEINFINTNGVG